MGGPERGHGEVDPSRWETSESYGLHSSMLVIAPLEAADKSTVASEVLVSPVFEGFGDRKGVVGVWRWLEVAPPFFKDNGDERVDLGVGVAGPVARK